MTDNLMKLSARARDLGFELFYYPGYWEKQYRTNKHGKKEKVGMLFIENDVEETFKLYTNNEDTIGFEFDSPESLEKFLIIREKENA